MSSTADRNTRQISPAKHWCFTLNNPTLDIDIDEIIRNGKVADYVVQEEVGESGTYHLQGYVSFKSKTRPKSVIKNDRIHWEKCRDISASKKYCSDADKRKPGGKLWENCLDEPLIDFIEGNDYYPWQASLIEILKGPIHPRQLHWITDLTGNRGKTAMMRHLMMTQKPVSATYVTGKSSDVKYAILQMKTVPKCILVGFVRSQENFISYQMLEEVKDGMFFSTKYESGMKIYNPPHLIVMANFFPDITKLSMDRWCIYRIMNDLSLHKLDNGDVLAMGAVDYRN